MLDPPCSSSPSLLRTASRLSGYTAIALLTLCPGIRSEHGDVHPGRHRAVSFRPLPARGASGQITATTRQGELREFAEAESSAKSAAWPGTSNPSLASAGCSFRRRTGGRPDRTPPSHHGLAEMFATLGSSRCWAGRLRRRKRSREKTRWCCSVSGLLAAAFTRGNPDVLGPHAAPRDGEARDDYRAVMPARL